MFLEKPKSIEDPAGKNFPIFSYEDYDFGLNVAWPIGLKSTYPEELIRRIGAAVISLHMGNTAVDYTYRRYLKGRRYEMNDGSRLDLCISREIKNKSAALSSSLSLITELEPKNDGQFVSEWTFLRIPFAIEFLLSCANRGAFFESAAIARMILEQIAWCNAIDGLTDVAVIQKTSATKSIGILKQRFEGVGQLYGWLSAHAHWAYDGHVKAMHFEDGKTASLFATPKFKASSLALTVLIAILAIKLFATLRQAEISLLLNSAAVEPRHENRVEEFEKSQRLDALRSMSDFSALCTLIKKIAEHYPDSPDIADLSRIALGECEDE